MMRLALAVGCALLLGCRILIVSGPYQVAVGDTVTYVLDLAVTSSDGGETLYVTAEVPEGWTLQSNSYVGTINGMPVSGSGIEHESEVCDSLLEEIRAGFKRVRLMAGPFTLTDTDTGTVTLNFTVQSQPEGEFDIFFIQGATQFSGSLCSTPVGRTINRSRSTILRFANAIFENDPGIGGLDGVNSVAMSPDGRHVYATGTFSDAVTTFSRDRSTGELDLVEILYDSRAENDKLIDPVSVLVSPDGRHLYVASSAEDAINAFSRDATTGRLTFVGFVPFDIPYIGLLALSPDGNHLYAARSSDPTIATYSRDVVTGLLGFVGDSSAGSSVLDTVTVSPDGLHVYALGFHSHTIVVLARDAPSGSLNFVEQLVNGSDGITDLFEPNGITVSPDGAHVYVVTRRSSGGALLIFARDTAAGRLHFVTAMRDERPGINGLQSASSVAVTAGGGHVLTGGRAIMVFQRAAASGRLSFIESHFEGVGNLDSLVLSPDERSLYAAANNALTIHQIPPVFTDSFESGDTSAWSVRLPRAP